MKDLKDILNEIKNGTSVDEIVRMLKENGFGNKLDTSTIKSEEEYYNTLDKEFRFGTDEYYDLDEPFWEYENFFPETKSVGDGAWIKVKTDIGYNVYYAKKTKKQFNKTNIERKLQTQQKQINKILELAQNNITDFKKSKILLEKSVVLMNKNKELYKELLRAEMLETLGIEPYCVKYRVSKSKWQVVTPCEYELSNDIELYVKVINDMGKTEAVTYKSLFTYVDDNIIFYLQSRGISKDTAIMLSKLKDCYFICNVSKMMQMVIQPIHSEEVEV